MTGGEGAGVYRQVPGCSVGIPDPSKRVIHCAKSHIRPLRGERGARGRLFGVHGERGGGSRSETLSEKVSSSCFFQRFLSSVRTEH